MKEQVTSVPCSQAELKDLLSAPDKPSVEANPNSFNVLPEEANMQ